MEQQEEDPSEYRSVCDCTGLIPMEHYSHPCGDRRADICEVCGIPPITFYFLNK